MRYVVTGREDDGRWYADIDEVPGVMAYGLTENEAIDKAIGVLLSTLGAQEAETGALRAQLDAALADVARWRAAAEAT